MMQKSTISVSLLVKRESKLVKEQSLVHRSTSIIKKVLVQTAMRKALKEHQLKWERTVDRGKYYNTSRNNDRR